MRVAGTAAVLSQAQPSAMGAPPHPVYGAPGTPPQQQPSYGAPPQHYAVLPTYQPQQQPQHRSSRSRRSCSSSIFYYRCSSGSSSGSSGCRRRSGRRRRSARGRLPGAPERARTPTRGRQHARPQLTLPLLLPLGRGAARGLLLPLPAASGSLSVGAFSGRQPLLLLPRLPLGAGSAAGSVEVAAASSEAGSEAEMPLPRGAYSGGSPCKQPGSGSSVQQLQQLLHRERLRLPPPSPRAQAGLLCSGRWCGPRLVHGHRVSHFRCRWGLLPRPLPRLPQCPLPGPDGSTRAPTR
ncbi:hypothetical protein T492DRAFT_364881 [Pavlovales sp. CCMP2436]|nr:hypothetical protein T492DRAFT_364881 [Pavlovales sp. CCMP2436]